jgi:hypothetical protein
VSSAFERYAHTAVIDSLVAKGIGVVDVRIIDEEGRDFGQLQVFGTHMQSERTKGAQKARREQAVQAAEFIVKHRAEDRCAAVFAGDMNMGPRREEGRGFSVHYSDAEDAEMRCAAYASMVAGCGFEEVRCEDGAYCGDICRFLTQGVDECALEYVDMRSSTGNRLSDTDAMCLSVVLKEV